MSEPRSRDAAAPSRRRRPLRVLAAFVVLLALAGYLVVQYVSNGGAGAPRCTVRAADGGDASHSVSPEQAGHAATIAAVGTAKGMPERAVTIALATAMQESGLRNLDHGDRDSLGLFQQRPSQGWGTPAQVRDPVYAAGIFYDRLAEVRGYSRLPLTVAAQRVQLSGFPQAYAKHEPEAALLAAALTGRAPAALSCTGPAPTEPGDAAAVRTELVRAFGADGAAGAGPAGRSAVSGRVLTVPVPADEPRRGWELAHWAVANAARLNLAEVAYGGRVWRAGEDRGAWGSAEAAGAGGASGVRVTVSAGK
ncbi:hypothetical protein [Streptomyces sp. NPDC097619]|uniref:hypothetical protein n=1 Tax=Streptomyces sp. NPDC097619 TaxID=3157228 RepID=UPI0033253FEC